MPKVGCTVEGCETRKHEALGLCKKHYTASRPRYPDRKVQMTCDGCGATIWKEPSRLNRYTHLYCSRTCANDYRFQSTRQHKMRVDLYKPKPRPSTTPAVNVLKAKRRTFVSGQCEVCESWFICLYGSSTCSAECQAIHRARVLADAKARRRARQHKAHRAPVYRSRIFRRDQYICQLCGDPLEMNAQVPEPYAPTIDHVVPLALGGTHEPDNVQAAHFICNCLKGATMPEKTRLAA